MNQAIVFWSPLSIFVLGCQPRSFLALVILAQVAFMSVPPDPKTHFHTGGGDKLTSKIVDISIIMTKTAFPHREWKYPIDFDVNNCKTTRRVKDAIFDCFVKGISAAVTG